MLPCAVENLIVLWNILNLNNIKQKTISIYHSGNTFFHLPNTITRGKSKSAEKTEKIVAENLSSKPTYHPDTLPDLWTVLIFCAISPILSPTSTTSPERTLSASKTTSTTKPKSPTSSKRWSSAMESPEVAVKSSGKRKKIFCRSARWAWTTRYTGSCCRRSSWPNKILKKDPFSWSLPLFTDQWLRDSILNLFKKFNLKEEMARQQQECI